MEIEGLPEDPDAALPPEHVVEAMRGFLGSFFPLLAASSTSAGR